MEKLRLKITSINWCELYQLVKESLELFTFFTVCVFVTHSKQVFFNKKGNINEFYKNHMRLWQNGERCCMVCEEWYCNKLHTVIVLWRLLVKRKLQIPIIYK